MPEGRIAAIDGLRALALLLVTAQHCGLMPLGWTGVWLFYVLSGFVIARNFELGAYTGTTRLAAWGEFMRRRLTMATSGSAANVSPANARRTCSATSSL